MAWSASAMFVNTIKDCMNRAAAAVDLDADAFKSALFDNSITPDKTVSSANSAYAAGVWASGGVSDVTGWPAAGRSLVTVTSAVASNVWKFDADDTASANSNTTLLATYGTLVYDDTTSSPADQGLCFNYFGGAQQVTAGSFTIVWNSSGIATITT